jgi:phosphate transport system protein
MVRARNGENLHQLFDLALHACLVAKDAAFNTGDLVANHTIMAHLAVKQCERELDRIEKQIDEEMPPAITRVGEGTARELVAALRLITDLERIGDLMWGIARQLRPILNRIPEADCKQLAAMATAVQKMLDTAHQGFLGRNTDKAYAVIRTDAEVDHLCKAIFRRYLLAREPENPREAITIVLAAQALERAGDHAKNVAEELLHLVERRSVLHGKRHLRESA